MALSSAITYMLDGIDLSTFGIHMSASDGVLDLPSLKQPQTYDWPDYHGVIVDLEKPRYNTRSLIFDAWVETSEGMIDFAERIRSFYDVIAKPGLHQLLSFNSPDRPFAFMVYMKDGMEVKKKWRDVQMYGTFKMKFEEPEPVKRVVRYTGDRASVSFSSTDAFNIYWGDGTVDYDVVRPIQTPAGLDDTVTHEYSSAGTYYICFSGNVDSLGSFSTNGTVIWE